MASEKLNRWLTLVANFAVVAGIVFLAVELQQNTHQLRLQSYQAWQGANTDINMTIADPELSAIVARGHTDSRNLSKDEYIAYAMYHMSLLQMAQSTHYLYLQGALDEELWESEMDRAAGILTLNGVRQWWDAGGRTQLAPGFVSYIESVEPGKTVRWNWDSALGFFAGNFTAQESDGFFNVDGVPIHYMDFGSGEPVVLMHGLNDSFERAWIETDIARALIGAGYRVLALDARAHGQSGTPHDPAKYGREMSLDIVRLMDHVGVDKAHIVGYSMGARIVGKLRDLHPDRFISMCIGGLGWVQDEGAGPGQINLAESLESGEGFMPLYRNLYPDWSEEDRQARSDQMLETIPDPLATDRLCRV
jgi:hypothetical protein